jgi:ATP-dependent DNA helicase PIF1
MEVKKETQPSFKLTDEQKIAFDAAELSHHNVLIMGKPGVGKSVLTRALVTDGLKDWTTAAPTGLAALNVGGKTLHSLFRLPVSQGIIAPDFNVFNIDDRTENFLRYRLKYLIIDEISMVRADTFDYLDRLLRNVKGVPGAPFGGIQIVMVGDFFQLPPVVVDDEKLQLKSYGYESPFVFSSYVFRNHRELFKIVMLNEVLRQIGDPTFINLLNEAREGFEATFPKHIKMVEMLNKQVGAPNDIRIKLAGTNKQAQEINDLEMRKINAPSKRFKAEKFGEWPALPVDEFLELKVGCQVMVKKNKADMPPNYSVRLNGPFVSKVVNGTLGVVENIGVVPMRELSNPLDWDAIDYASDQAFETANKLGLLDEEERQEFANDKVVSLKVMELRAKAPTNIFKRLMEEAPKKEVEKVTIRLDNGEHVNIYRTRWERKVKRKGEDGQWEEQVVASYEQMPLQLAWAISIHKSQGQSFDKVHINLSRIFAPGQAYVALSRCRSLAGISLEAPTSPKSFYSDKKVLEFTRSLKRK